jgi:ankyrin repeat protein
MKQYCLNRMILSDFSIDKLSVLLDKMNSVNYRDSYVDLSTLNPLIVDLSTLNPLIVSCANGKLDIVRLLIEKYNADIEYLSSYGCTPIMYSVTFNHTDVTKYLYDKGAKLNTVHDSVYKYANPSMKKLLDEWESKKQQKDGNIQSNSESEKQQKDFNDPLKLASLLNKLNNEKFSDEIIKKNFELIFPDKNSYSLELLKSIEFEKFSIHTQQYFLNWTIHTNISVEHICILLDKMKSVNYGDTSYNKYCFLSNNINPLIYCCQIGIMDLVQLFVEKYNANIDYFLDNDKTAIKVIACGTTSNFKEITEYLYKKGARLPTSCKEFLNYQAGWDIINKLEKELHNNSESEKAKKQSDELKEKYEKLKSDFDNLKSMFDVMKKS